MLLILKDEYITEQITIRGLNLLLDTREQFPWMRFTAICRRRTVNCQERYREYQKIDVRVHNERIKALNIHVYSRCITAKSPT